ncbi:hypothetical protein F5Y17DRAFT_470952 [Xylariaceae sp. FL0594]|nr:hypothetical protein F5Y17DRAFT_470952 [Xylariaceae sp. FL0594]
MSTPYDVEKLVPPVDHVALAALLEPIPTESDNRRMFDYEKFLQRDWTHSIDEEKDKYKVCGNPTAYFHLLRPWHDQDWQYELGRLEPRDALHRQWKRWKEFRHWELHKRRMKPSFEDYFETYKRHHFIQGGSLQEAYEPDFESNARNSWELAYKGWPYSGSRPFFKRHAQFVETAFLHHAAAKKGIDIRRPLQLSLDLKMQDQWSTYVEYFAFEVVHLDRLARYEEIKREGISMIEKIQEEQKAAAGKSHSSKKADATDEADETGEVVEVVETVEADQADQADQIRQGKRRRPSTDEQEEETIPEPPSKSRKVADTRDNLHSLITTTAAIAASTTSVVASTASVVASTATFTESTAALAASLTESVATLAESTATLVASTATLFTSTATRVTSTAALAPSNITLAVTPASDPPKVAAAPPAPDLHSERLSSLRPRVSRRSKRTQSWLQGMNRWDKSTIHNGLAYWCRLTQTCLKQGAHGTNSIGMLGR